MTVTELMTQFANPHVVHSLSAMDKLTAGLITTILGMGITFMALIILQFIIALMDKVLNNAWAKSATFEADLSIAEKSPDAKEELHQDDNELVAVIASVIAMKLKTSIGNIVIKNIEKLEDRSPAWNRAGIIDQMNNRF